MIPNPNIKYLNLSKHDRFLPTLQKLNHETVNPPESSKGHNLEVSLRDDGTFVRSHITVDEEGNRGMVGGRYDSNMMVSNETNSNTSISSSPSGLPTRHQGVIAQALGISLTEKIFKFGSKVNDRRDNGEGLTKMLIHSENEFKSLCSITSSISSSLKYEPEYANNIVVTRCVQAPGLRNDFYSNLVSWSSITNDIVVALGNYAGIWGLKNNDVVPIFYDDTDYISTVSCSSSDYMAIGTIHGSIILLSQVDGNKLMDKFVVPGKKGIHAIEWFKSGKKFLASDHFGDVILFEIIESHMVDLITQEEIKRAQLVKLFIFSGHRQLVCGISLNVDESQLALGSNDSTVTIWDITTLTSPQLKVFLPHRAAIKAIKFCPWAKSLLVTGSGTKDRTIRFWHSISGTLLSSHYTDGQITSLNWSTSAKQIVATFGYGNNPSVVTLFSYPDMQILSTVNAMYEFIVLSTSMSPNNKSICVATNDETIRIYQVGHQGDTVTPLCPKSGTFGSSLIELYEGVDKKIDIIR